MKRVSFLSFCSILVMALILSSAFCGYANSQSKSKVVVEKMKEALVDLVSAEVFFNYELVSSTGMSQGGNAGFFVVQGDAYNMSIDSYSVYCDGSTKWVHDLDNNEITIFPYDGKDVSFLENPMTILKNFNAADYRIPERIEVVGSGKNSCYKLVVADKKKDEVFKQIIIYVSVSDFLPRKIDFTGRNGDRYVLDINSIVSVAEKSIEFFSPDKSLLEDPEVYVTDMR